MAAPIDLRNDFDSVSLRRLAKRTRDATQSRRLLALAEVYDGGSRTDASRIGGVGLQIIRDWVLRFNARGPDGLVDGKSPGAPSKLNADHRRALAEVVEAGPVPAVDGVVRWRRKDLARWLLETFAISLDETTVGRELKALGFAKISARPRHYAQNELAVEAFKKNFPAELAKIRARLPKGVEIELWWQDEARIGQKNKLTRRWARRGTRPRARQLAYSRRKVGSFSVLRWWARRSSGVSVMAHPPPSSTYSWPPKWFRHWRAGDTGRHPGRAWADVSRPGTTQGA